MITNSTIDSVQCSVVNHVPILAKVFKSCFNGISIIPDPSPVYPIYKKKTGLSSINNPLLNIWSWK